MKIEELFVPYELALKLKEKGYNEPCLSYYDSRGIQQIGTFDFTTIDGYKESVAALAPLYQQVVDFLREKHDIQINIEWNKFYPNTPYVWSIRPTWRDQLLQPYGYSGFSSDYYNALTRAIEEALKLI